MLDVTSDVLSLPTIPQEEEPWAWMRAVSAHPNWYLWPGFDFSLIAYRPRLVVAMCSVKRSVYGAAIHYNGEVDVRLFDDPHGRFDYIHRFVRHAQP